MDASSSYSGIPTGYPYERERSFHERDRLEYELTVRQEPKQARMCGVGADRRPIDPPPIIQLRVIDPNTRQPPSPANLDIEDGDPNYAHSFLQNPYYFMFASLAKPDDDTELHWLKDGKTRCTTGSVVSSLYHLKDTENRNEDAGFFVFPDLSVRTEGSYRLKLSLFEVVGNTVRHCKSIYSAPFYVYTAKKFPGMEESTPLSCSLADQGIKIRIRKDIRVRKRPIAALAAPLDSGQGHGDNGKMEDEHGETEEHQQAQQLHSHGHQGHMGASQSSSTVTAKRARHGTLTGPLSLPSGPSSSGAAGGEMTPHTPSSANPASVALPGLPAWPTSTSLDPMLGVASAPGGIELTHTHTHPHSVAGTIGSAHPGGGVGGTIPPPPGAAYEGSRMASGTGVGNIPPPPGAQLLSGGENSGSSSVRRGSVLPLSSSSSASSLAQGSVGANASAQNLSPVGPPPPGAGAGPGSIYDRMSYETPRSAYDSGTRGASYDQQRGVGGGAGYENGNGRSGYDNASGRNGYDNASGRNGYENGGGRGGYDHPQQQRGSYESRGSYDSQSHSRGSYDAQTHAQSQRTSYNAPYDVPPGPPTQTYQDGHNQGGYTHPHQQQQTSANYPQPSQTHAYPGTSSHTHHQGQYPPTRSQYSATAPGHGYPNSYQPAQGPQGRYDYTTPSASANANSSGTYYDNPPQPSPASASSTSQAHSYYSNAGPTHSTSVPPPLHHHSPTSATSATSPSTWAPPAPPPLTHTQSYASSTASGGSQYEYGGQGQGQSNEYYQHPQGQPHPHQHPSTSASHSGRVLSPGPGPSPNISTSRYAPPSSAGQYSGSEPSHARGPPPFASGAPSAPAWGPNGGAGTHQQQEMIHLAPLRHAGVASGASSSSSPSSPPLSSVVGAGAGGGGGQGRGYPSLMQFSRAPFEQDTGRGGMGLPGVPGKKSVLSIGSIISDGG